MFTERILRNNPACVKAFTGIPASEFWAWLEQMETAMLSYEVQRLNRTATINQRAVDARWDFDQPLAVRIILPCGDQDGTTDTALNCANALQETEGQGADNRAEDIQSAIGNHPCVH